MPIGFASGVGFDPDAKNYCTIVEMRHPYQIVAGEKSAAGSDNQDTAQKETMHRKHNNQHERDRRIVCGIADGLMHRLPQEEVRQAIEKLDAKIANNLDDSPSLIARGLLHNRMGDDRKA